MNSDESGNGDIAAMNALGFSSLVHNGDPEKEIGHRESHGQQPGQAHHPPGHSRSTAEIEGERFVDCDADNDVGGDMEREHVGEVHKAEIRCITGKLLIYKLTQERTHT